MALINTPRVTNIKIGVDKTVNVEVSIFVDDDYADSGSARLFVHFDEAGSKTLNEISTEAIARAKETARAISLKV